MAKRLINKAEIKDSRNVQYLPNEETEKRTPFVKRRRMEDTPLKSETAETDFNSKKLTTKLRTGDIDRLDGKDLLLFYKRCMEGVGNKCPIVQNSKTHYAIKNMIRAFSPRVVYGTILFLFEAEHNLIDKHVISVYYINKNIMWLQHFGKLYLEGEDFTHLLQMCKPIKNKFDEMVGNMRETDFEKDSGDSGW